jgi:hypothetical protein
VERQKPSRIVRLFLVGKTRANTLHNPRVSQTDGQVARLTNRLPPPRYLNVYVVGSLSYYGVSSLSFGYAAASPGAQADKGLDHCADWYDGLGTWNSTHSAKYQHIWLLWDRLDPFNDNSVANDNSGPSTLAHELGHTLGLLHTHPDYADGDCTNTDLVADTPVQRLQDGAGADVLRDLCSSMFVFPVTVSDVQGFNTCKKDKYIDNIWNVMGYSPALCRLYFTRGQVARMHAAVSKHMPRLGQR